MRRLDPSVKVARVVDDVLRSAANEAERLRRDTVLMALFRARELTRSPGGRHRYAISLAAIAELMNSILGTRYSGRELYRIYLQARKRREVDP